jgi:hypothetical protein
LCKSVAKNNFPVAIFVKKRKSNKISFQTLLGINHIEGFRGWHRSRALVSGSLQRHSWKLFRSGAAGWDLRSFSSSSSWSVFAALRQGAATFSRLSSVVTATLNTIKVCNGRDQKKTTASSGKRTASAGS